MQLQESVVIWKSQVKQPCQLFGKYIYSQIHNVIFVSKFSVAKCYILYEVCDIQQYWMYGFIDKNIHWVTQTEKRNRI